MVIDYSSRARKNIKKILLSDARVGRSMELRLEELAHNPIPPFAKVNAPKSSIAKYTTIDPSFPRWRGRA